MTRVTRSRAQRRIRRSSVLARWAARPRLLVARRAARWMLLRLLLNSWVRLVALLLLLLLLLLVLRQRAERVLPPASFLHVVSSTLSSAALAVLQALRALRALLAVLQPASRQPRAQRRLVLLPQQAQARVLVFPRSPTMAPSPWSSTRSTRTVLANSPPSWMLHPAALIPRLSRTQPSPRMYLVSVLED